MSYTWRSSTTGSGNGSVRRRAISECCIHGRSTAGHRRPSPATRADIGDPASRWHRSPQPTSRPSPSRSNPVKDQCKPNHPLSDAADELAVGAVVRRRHFFSASYSWSSQQDRATSRVHWTLPSERHRNAASAGCRPPSVTAADSNKCECCTIQTRRGTCTLLLNSCRQPVTPAPFHRYN